MASKHQLLAATTNGSQANHAGGTCKQRAAHKKHTWSRRSVATSTPSKTASQQVAHKQHSAEINPASTQRDDQTIGASASASVQQLQQEQSYQARLENLNLWHSVDTIKRLGHRMADLDPLRIRQPADLKSIAAWSYPLIERLRARNGTSQLPGGSETVETRGFLQTNQPLMTVNELIDTVLNIYAGSDCGLEFAHLSQLDEIEWLTSEWEKLNENFHLTQVEQHNLAKLLLECESFDHFMAAKFPTTKRYGCEGAESMLVVFDEIFRLCHLAGGDNSQQQQHRQALDDEWLTQSIGRIDDVIIGMPHRGRLNLLACLLGFDAAAIFAKTRGEPELDLREAWMAQGDVLSHLSTNCRFVYGLDKAEIGLSRDSPEPINVSLLPNPSHLEVASPMVAGSARGRAHNLHHNYSSSPKFVSLLRPDNKDHDEGGAGDYRKYLGRILPIQVHGDASVSGQGIVAETLQMANLPGFSVGGSLHLIVNNQIGYTTDPTLGRSSRYCTDVFKLIEAPIIHVNGQNIASLIRATRLALAYRQKFAKDVAIDLVCYRQHGHNEMDEPSFTQPLMYRTIRNRRSIPQLYCDSIGMSEGERAEIGNEFKGQLQDSFKRTDSFKPDNDNYRNFNLAREYHRDHICTWQTGCNLDILRSVALASVEVPENFQVHPNLKRVLVDERRKRFGALPQDGATIADIKVDWPTAEILAFGSLLKQKNSIRISGQDVARGTFSTRHVVLFDQQSEQAHIPLNQMQLTDGGEQAKLEVANTILSEEAALAYEFGYSTETCALTIWEAQFGDFFNTAQSIIDTLVSSGESKWLKQSALTLLLPHGLDGAGPEHSSAHLERFLQMSSSSSDSIDTEAKVNWSICYPTQPSQYFHLLRRQVLRPFRKPLVVMSPKTIFRHPECVSRLADFGTDRQFEPVLDDPTIVGLAHQQQAGRRQQIDTVVLCSGKIYFALAEKRRQHGIHNVALVRLEELCPFPVQSIVNILKLYPNLSSKQQRANNIVWIQEEHKNQGAFSFVETRMRNILDMPALKYIGRSESELPATGSSVLHKKEVEQIMKEFVSLKRHGQP